MINVLITKNEAQTLRERIVEWRKLTTGPLLQEVAQLTVDQARERVTTHKASPDLKAWPARKVAVRHPMLFKSGKMMRSIRKQRRGATEYEAGAASPYAKFQQFGTRKGIEPRAFVGVGFNDEKAITTAIETFVRLRFR